MATYKYQQNMFDGASEGYVKYNISPDLGTVVSAGTTITITGQAYHRSRANKCIEITTTGSNTYRSAFVNVNISKATVTSFTLKFQMWELSSAWGTTRVVNAPINFTLWSAANCGGNGDGTFNTSSQAISYLTYRISPAAKTVQFERYSLSGSTYVKNDEGTKVMGKLAISLAEGRTAADITTAKVVVTSDAGTAQTITLSTAVLNAALTANGYVESAPSLFSSITFNTAYNYTLTFTIRSINASGYYTVPVVGSYIRGILIECRRDEISKFLYYSWLYYTTVGTDFSDLGKMSPMAVNDQDALNKYLDVMQTSPVETWPGHISVTAIYTPEDIRSSVPAVYFSEQTRKNMEKQRLSCGADELAERVAMLDIDGSNAIQFMSCVRYGDRWYNRTPMSILAMIAGTETYSCGLVWQ